MMKSNKAIGSGSFGASSMAQDLSTIDNIKIRRQVMSQHKAIMMGNAQRAVESAKTLRLESKAANKDMKPLVRKRTAREFAND